MKKIWFLVVFSLVTVAAAQEAPKQPEEGPPQAAVEEPQAPNAAPKLGHPLDPEDVRILTSRPQTSVPAAQRAGYGAPQVYVTAPLDGYGLGATPMFQYRSRVPLFNAPVLAPIPFGFGTHFRPTRPVVFFNPLSPRH